MSMNCDEKIEICKRTRVCAQQALHQALQTVLEKHLTPSEVEMRDMWLAELRRTDTIFKDGWYSPPPHGLGVLIGTDNDGANCRLNYQSLRPEHMWPRSDIRLNTTSGIMYAYASPFDKNSGVIGDFGVTLYFGAKEEIINHLVLSYTIVKQVFDFVERGQKFSDIARRLKSLITSHGLNNEIVCVTNPSSADDVGHTIPFIMEDMNEQELVTLKHGDYDAIKKMISEKRIFVRVSQKQKVRNGMAFSIEPRPKVVGNPKIPMASFHSICAIYENGEKKLITNFDEIFHLVGMQYMH